MKKKLLLLLFVISLFSINTCSAAAALDYSTDWQIGPFRLNDAFNVTLANKMFGQIQVINNDGRVGADMVRSIYLDKGFIAVKGNALKMVSTSDPALATPRGIRVGDTLSKVVAAYGFPTYTKKMDEFQDMYVYGSNGYEITFIAVPSGMIIKMVVSYPVL